MVNIKTVIPMLFVSAFISIGLIGCNNVPDEQVDKFNELQQRVETIQTNNYVTNEELVSMLNEIRENENGDLSTEYLVLEGMVQGKIEEKYQDIYNKKLVELTQLNPNNEEFEKWKKNWKEQLIIEQEQNKLFTKQFYDMFVLKL